MTEKFVMLTFDLEEFDIPEEYGQTVSEYDQMNVTLSGMERLLKVLEKHQINATFFTTGNFARYNSSLIKKLAEKHEIASHAMYHSPTHDFKESDIEESMLVLKSITGKDVSGFRMPRLRSFDRSKLSGMGIRYSSSTNPTYLPGRYNSLDKNPLPAMQDGMMELPCSTVPVFRFPLFWLSFKNLPTGLYNSLCRITLNSRKNLMLYYHPWEFADIGDYKLPGYVKSPDGEKLTSKLELLIQSLLAQGATFVTCSKFIGN
ncbi:polysaccharide deacetylase family protein [Dyadobacter pollutisoli]|uniref:Polysaccharide deacetylase family protein n=1 Tax=Dyadobacter pollutisoli TaxID=2910158 RepID=A0A9E8SS01_9BACT|nr:polysaccharide deacetylase family protein [Dyadobacter pollutisoli]WAC14777.1 polysaccharide deacetylase family protein [Dyadobacter pollutisoli]